MKEENESRNPRYRSPRIAIAMASDAQESQKNRRSPSDDDDAEKTSKRHKHRHHHRRHRLGSRKQGDETKPIADETDASSPPPLATRPHEDVEEGEILDDDAFDGISTNNTPQYDAHSATVLDQSHNPNLVCSDSLSLRNLLLLFLFSEKLPISFCLAGEKTQRRLYMVITIFFRSKAMKFQQVNFEKKNIVFSMVFWPNRLYVNVFF